MVEFSLEDAAVFLPKYLSADQQRGLYSELKNFPNSNFTFYDQSVRFKNDLLQGDGWKGLTAINFMSLDKKDISGIIISNSCDIDITNTRDFDINILFAPLVKLGDFRQLLLKSGQDPTAVENKIHDIKRQYNSSIFYLPECPHVFEESIVLLDDIHRHPLSDFAQKKKTKLSTLTMAAFYLFLIKLSIHFHRVQENVPRQIAS